MRRDDILDFNDIIQAHRAINHDLPNHSIKKLFHHADKTQIREFLESLAYHVDHHDPFRCLGLFELDGPNPTHELIENRRKFASNIITHFGGSGP